MRGLIIGCVSLALGCSPLFEDQPGTDSAVSGPVRQCADGIYTADRVVPRRQTNPPGDGLGPWLRSGAPEAGHIEDGRLAITGRAGEPYALLIDFFQPPAELSIAVEGVFEASTTRPDAVLTLWQQDGTAVRVAFGAGQLVFTGTDGRLDVLPLAGGARRIGIRVDALAAFVTVDGVGVQVLPDATLNLADPPPSRLPAVELSLDGPGRLVVDWLAWRCPPAPAVCALDRLGATPDPVLCTSQRAAVGPCAEGRGAAVEICNGLDDDCDGAADEDFARDPQVPGLVGRFLGDRCERGACVGPRAGRWRCAEDGLDLRCDTDRAEVERCGDLLDNDCDGRVDESGVDADGDGVQVCERCRAEPPPADCVAPFDCDDGDPLTGGQLETCDGADNDCDGRIDETFDVDRDGAFSCTAACRPGEQRWLLDPERREWRSCRPDCDDQRPDLNPGAQELCDGEDNDCDGVADEDFKDPSGLYLTDAHCGACDARCTTVPGQHIGAVCQIEGGQPRCVAQCDPGWADADDRGSNGCECRLVEPVVCDDGQPNAGRCDEICDGVDSDCDGLIDETRSRRSDCYGGPEGTEERGLCQPGRRACVGGVLMPECSGQILPAPEICDGLDTDCDGLVDEGLGAPTACYEGPPESRELGLCQSGIQRCVDGEISPCLGQLLPGVERCNGLDEDCDGAIDEGTDQDGDGVRPCAPCAEGLCVADCNDGNPDVNPAAAEQCNGVDDDCDTWTDEAFVRLDPASEHPVDSQGRETRDPSAMIYTGVLAPDGTISHCGRCGRRCVRANAVANCDEGRCAIGQCRDGWRDADTLASNGCELPTCAPQTAGFALLGEPCARPFEAPVAPNCGCDGLYECLDEGDAAPAIACNAIPADVQSLLGWAEEPRLLPLESCPPDRRVGAVAELADGLDNDCDGQVDEQL